MRRSRVGGGRPLPEALAIAEVMADVAEVEVKVNVKVEVEVEVEVDCADRPFARSLWRCVAV